MWHTKKLNEVCDIQSGLWKGKKGPYTTALVLRNTNFTASGVFDYSNVVELEVEAKQLANREVVKNDIILEKSGGGDKTPVGRVCIHDKESKIPFSLSNFTARIRVLDSKELNAEFLHKFLYFLYISGKTEPMQRHSTGIRNLQLTQYKDIDVPLPPLLEQERIVAKLDAAFAEIDEVKSSIEQNINNATSIFSTYLHEKINSISDSKELMLGDAIETLTDYHANGSYKILKNHVELKDIDDYAWMVRSTDFEKGFKNQKKYITKAAYEFLSKSKIFGNELLMSKIGNAGKIYLMPKIDRPTSLAMNMFLIRFDESIALNEYVYICLSSHLGNQQIINRLHGAATQTITKAAVRSIKIPICSLQEQKKIIFEINSMQEKTFVLSKILQKNLKNQHELKKAILSKSFLAESHHHAA